MSSHESEPARRFRRVRSQGPADVARETAESVLPGLPRVGALDALLREVDGLRLTLETDLSLAAAAVEAGAVDVAGEIIDSDRRSLDVFETRALHHLADLAADGTAVTHSWWRHIPAAPFVAAAAVVGFLVGVVPQLTGPATTSISTDQASANESLAQLTQLAASGRTADVRSAAEELHSQLQALILQASTDPAAAQRGLALLSAERIIIASSGDSQALGDVLAASAQLSRQIFQALPRAVRSVSPTVAGGPVVIPSARPSSSPSSATTTKASPKPTSSPKPSASPSAKPSAKPSPSGSPSSGPDVLPTSPAVKP